MGFSGWKKDFTTAEYFLFFIMGQMSIVISLQQMVGK